MKHTTWLATKVVAIGLATGLVATLAGCTGGNAAAPQASSVEPTAASSQAPTIVVPSPDPSSTPTGAATPCSPDPDATAVQQAISGLPYGTGESPVSYDPGTQTLALGNVPATADEIESVATVLLPVFNCTVVAVRFAAPQWVPILSQLGLSRLLSITFVLTAKDAWNSPTAAAQIAMLKGVAALPTAIQFTADAKTASATLTHALKAVPSNFAATVRLTWPGPSAIPVADIGRRLPSLTELDMTVSRAATWTPSDFKVFHKLTTLDVGLSKDNLDLSSAPGRLIDLVVDSGFAAGVHEVSGMVIEGGKAFVAKQRFGIPDSGGTYGSATSLSNDEWNQVMAGLDKLMDTATAKKTRVSGSPTSIASPVLIGGLGVSSEEDGTLQKASYGIPAKKLCLDKNHCTSVVRIDERLAGASGPSCEYMYLGTLTPKWRETFIQVWNVGAKTMSKPLVVARTKGSCPSQISGSDDVNGKVNTKAALAYIKAHLK